MSLPCSENEDKSCKVKIFVGYSNGRVVEHECTDEGELMLVKNLGLKNYKTSAFGAMKFAPLRECIIDKFGKLINSEIKQYAKKPDCTFKFRGIEKLAEYTNEKLLLETKTELPITHSIVSASLPTHRNIKFKLNKTALIMSSLCSTWMSINNFYYRNNTLLILGGCCLKEAGTFQKLGMSSHVNTMRNMQEKASLSYDKAVTAWKYEIELNAKMSRLLEEALLPSDTTDGMEICTIEFSPEALKSRCPHYSEEVYTACKELLPEVDFNVYEDTDLQVALNSIKKTDLPKYRIVGDNWDLEVKARCQTKASTNKSLHYFNTYAVKDRVKSDVPDDGRPQKVIADIEMDEFLPTPEVHKQMMMDLSMLLPRLLIRYLTPYKVFEKGVVSHIPHEHLEEMKMKSEVCPLGLQFLNSNKSAEMALILDELQEKYVPKDDKEILERLPFDGDQLTDERARNAQLANVLAQTPLERLEGLTPAFADWHLKKLLLVICWTLFFKDSSAAEMGTSCASMNRSAKSNAKRGPEADYNSYKDFSERETEAHVIARWLIFTGMKDMESPPTTRPIPDTSNWTTERKGNWIINEVNEFLSEVFQRASVTGEIVQLDEAHRQGFSCRAQDCAIIFPLQSARVRHEVQRHNLIVDNGGDNNRDRFGYFKCRREQCPLLFTTSSSRERHEKTQHTGLPVTEVPITDEPQAQPSSLKNKEDYLYNYHNGRLQMGLLLMNISDAIREGDGVRLTQCYKLALLFFYKYRHTKYSYVVLLFFVQLQSVLSKQEAHSLVNNRFVNTSGKPGGNIPLDLHMEHLNGLLKRLAKGMGGNVTQKSLQRAARSVVSLNDVMDSLDKDCGQQKKKGHHGSKNPEETVQIIVKDLVIGNVFDRTPGRSGYPSFAHFKANILDIDYRDFFSWAKEKLNNWKGIYETTGQ